MDSYRSVFEETSKEDDYSEDDENTKRRSYNVKPLKEILGEDAEEKLKIKLFDAPEYFDDDEERQEVDGVIKQMFDFVSPFDVKNQIVFGMDPDCFMHSTLNPNRRQ